MNIGVDMRPLVAGVTGIARYTGCILDELQRIDLKNNYYLFECRKSSYVPTNQKWKKVSGNWRHVSTIWQQLILPTLLKKHKIDILWLPEQIGPVFRPLPNTKLVTTVHDFAVLRHPEMIMPVNLFLKRFLIPMTMKKSTALLPVSEYIRKELFEFYPYVESSLKIIKIVGNAVKKTLGEINPRKRENFLFFPGNLEPRKNHLRLIKALEIVNASGFELNLHLVGPAGWKNAELRKQINSGPLKDRIKYLGVVTDEELRNQYLSCAALVFPSIYEGFGIPVLEALMSDTPVLTSRGTVMEEIAGRNAMYFDPYSAESIAQTIIEFLKSGGPAIDKTSLNGYTWEKAAENLLSVFEEVGRTNGSAAV
jgi:glycosyltransferase involved in cell wall biosynthesis